MSHEHEARRPVTLYTSSTLNLKAYCKTCFDFHYCKKVDTILMNTPCCISDAIMVLNLTQHGQHTSHNVDDEDIIVKGITGL